MSEIVDHPGTSGVSQHIIVTYRQGRSGERESICNHKFKGPWLPEAPKTVKEGHGAEMEQGEEWRARSLECEEGQGGADSSGARGRCNASGGQGRGGGSGASWLKTLLRGFHLVQRQRHRCCLIMPNLVRTLHSEWLANPLHTISMGSQHSFQPFHRYCSTSS